MCVYFFTYDAVIDFLRKKKANNYTMPKKKKTKKPKPK